ncbi:MAG TPA: enolase C-terminal domain-like protein [Anaeromyxobacteraceae bacterium]|nr:enolase C-terminal domain-like protein [Anaeromyxobacteraceae bacterium]
MAGEHRARSDPAIDSVDVRAATIPTDAPESDGTFEWDRTTIVLAVARAGGETGFGWTYADTATARLARDVLAPLVRGRAALDVEAAYGRMYRSIRNLGRPGIAAMAISAVDAALWDLKARLLGLALVKLLGAARDAVDAYGSGGFTSYTVPALQAQLGGWAELGLARVKMKIGRDAAADVERVAAAREAIGPAVQLFVDANGAYSRKLALAQAERFARQGVAWFEEPVSSDDLAGLRLLRDRAPAGMDVAAGEYGYDPFYFRRMLEAGAVDVLQADATRCGGPSGFLRAAALCDAFGLPLSAHCGPQLHAHLCCAAARAVHVEWFHDHSRIERMLFDGALEIERGQLRPDASRPGVGVEPRWQDFERYEVKV